jgi:hypothetical protein
MSADNEINFQRELDAVRTIRDELKLKAHLAKSDLKDELARLEGRWDRLEQEVRRTASHTKEPLLTIGRKAQEALTELRQGYENIKRQLGA